MTVWGRGMALVQIDSWLGPGFLEGEPTGLADRLDVRVWDSGPDPGDKPLVCHLEGGVLSGGLEKAVWGCGLSDVMVLKSATYAATVHPFKGQSLDQGRLPSAPNLEYRSSKAPYAPQAACNEGGTGQGQQIAEKMSPCYRSEV